MLFEIKFYKDCGIPLLILLQLIKSPPCLTKSQSPNFFAIYNLHAQTLQQITMTFKRNAVYIVVYSLMLLLPTITARPVPECGGEKVVIPECYPREEPIEECWDPLGLICFKK